VDNFDSTARLCEAYGFDRPAAVLRARSMAKSKVYLVVERPFEYSEYGYWMREKEGLPRTIFLDRAKAERLADDRNIEAFRRLRPFNADDFADSPPWPTEAEMSEKIGEILGRPFPWPNVAREVADPDDEPAVFPASATDDQMRRIIGLFHLTFFYVQEVEVASGRADLARTGDRP
jgi:hypothetical protein